MSSSVRRCLLGVCLVVVLALVGLRAEESKNFGPLEVLDNGIVVVEVAPKIGRIVSYHRKEEPNWLVAVDQPTIPSWHFHPWAGDRVWPTAQFILPQIYPEGGFDPVIDGAPWEVVSKTATGITLRSGLSPQLGLRVERRVELEEKSTVVRHTYHLERVEESRYPVHAWTVTGVRAGGYVLMETDPHVKHDNWKRYKNFSGPEMDTPKPMLFAELNALQVPAPASAVKLGTYGRWIALVSGNSAFLQTIRYDARELFLEASNLQTFQDSKHATFEIETLSPTWYLRKGEARDWTVTWQLLDFPKGDETAAQRVKVLAERVGK